MPIVDHDVWPGYKVRLAPKRRRRCCEVVTNRGRRLHADAAYHQQTVETMRLLWLAIGRDPDVQRRVMELLHETRKEAGYEED